MDVILCVIKRADALQVDDVITLPGRYFSDDKSQPAVKVRLDSVELQKPVLKTYGFSVFISYVHPGTEGPVHLTYLEDDEYFACLPAES